MPTDKRDDQGEEHEPADSAAPFNRDFYEYLLSVGATEDHARHMAQTCLPPDEDDPDVPAVGETEVTFLPGFPRGRGSGNSE